jgi:hypothetical protein
MAVAIGLAGAYLKAMAEIDPKDILFPLGMMSVGGVGTVVLGSLAYAGMGRSVEVRENGIVLRRFGRFRPIPWDAIHSLKETMSPRADYPLHWLFLEVPGQKRVWLTNALADSDELFRVICEQFSKRKLATVLSALELGQPVIFGDLKLTSAGFENDGKKLGYESVQSLRVATGVFEIHKLGQSKPWYACPFGEIPNGPLLLAVLEERGRAMRAEPI